MTMTKAVISTEEYVWREYRNGNCHSTQGVDPANLEMSRIKQLGLIRSSHDCPSVFVMAPPVNADTQQARSLSILRCSKLPQTRLLGEEEVTVCVPTVRRMSLTSAVLRQGGVALQARTHIGDAKWTPDECAPV
jgi:hypothetical protein